MLEIWIMAGLLAQEAAGERKFEIEAGRRIPLTFLKGVSTRTAIAGDPIYLETLFPIMAGGRVAIPRGSYVAGSVLEVKRAGKVKGRAELRVRLETLILPNGTSRDFRGSLGGVDSETGEVVDREGKVKGKGGLMNDAKNVATAAGIGAAAGAAVGGLTTIGANGGSDAGDLASVVRRPAAGAGIGMAGGAAAMLVASLFLRGPDAVLAKGTDVEMVLDVPMQFREAELPGNAGAASRSEAEATESGLKKRK